MNYYGINDYRNYFRHYGVLGMKWGVRHDKPSGTRHRGKNAMSNLKKSRNISNSSKDNRSKYI